MKRGAYLACWCTIALVLGPCSGRAQELVTDENEVAYSLKVGYVTYDAVKPTITSSAFNQLQNHLIGLCAASRRGNRSGKSEWLRFLDAEIAFGSDYQVLSWLRSGRIDAALLSPESLHFFDTGMTNLIPLVVPGRAPSPPVSRPGLRSLRYRNQTWMTQTNPEQDYQAFLKSIANPTSKGSPDRTRYQLVATSHFSGPGFIAPVAYASQWLNSRRPTNTMAQAQGEDHFWNSFFSNLVFSVGRSDASSCVPAPSEDTLLIEFGAEGHGLGPGWKGFADTNCVVFAKFTNFLVSRGDTAKKIYAAPLPDKSPLLTNLPPVVQSLLTNIHLAEPKFTIAELMALLQQSQETSGEKELSLVLSGGGVKAAYQSKLVDYLYSRKFLSNSTNPPARTLQVKSVAGNSGGALLGYFVAGLEPGDRRSLSTNLWQPGGRLMTDRKIFGFMDMPRWASFVVCIWVLITVLRMGRIYLDDSPAEPPAGVPRPPAAGDALPKCVPWPYRVGMALMLILTPILLQIVNGEYGIEHVPWLEGFFYFLCLCLVLFIDHCVVVKPDAAPHPLGALQLVGRVLLLIGGGITLLLPWCSQKGWPVWLMNDLGGQMTIGGAVFCGTVLLAWVGLILWMVDRARYGLHEPCRFVKMVVMAIGIILLVYLSMGILVLLNCITLLEMTLGFWLSLIALTLCWSVLYGWFFASDRLRGWPLVEWLRDGFLYQRSRHPSGTLSLTRLARTHLVFTAGYCLWNAIVAPAIYGNKVATHYLREAVSRFLQDSGQSNKVYELQTLYAAPANDLAARRERYFLFYPTHGDTSSIVALTERLSDDARKRWTVLPYSKEDPTNMQRVVFASGSPFPIFPPHAIPATNGIKERLVDGGFAHNIPVEAARQLGARQVIVLDSSPPSGAQRRAAGSDAVTTFIGQLTRNVPRLVPFLFETSQIADLLSREEMFIVWIAPREDEVHWPSLMDFRQKTVRRMLDTAERDTTARIGRIEASGIPSFHLFIRTNAGWRR